MVKVTVILALCFAAVSAYPAKDPIIAKWSEGLRYDYLEDDNGVAHLVDNWMKISDFDRLARYNPDSSNNYHLFTRANPTRSQPLGMNNILSVWTSNFDAKKHTIVLMHGFAGSASSGFNTVLVPAYLEAEDCNVIVLDWSAGSYWGPRALQAGQAAGRFINWLNSVTGATSNAYTIVGYSVGGHGAGIIARTINGNVGYVIGCDPAERWDKEWLFSSTDGTYTEVIHTNAGNIGVTEPLAHVDFYPNGGNDMPGCLTPLCDHYRSYYYLGESVRFGGFTGSRCATLNDALRGTCDSNAGTLNMGGFYPKTGNTGLYHLLTSRQPPFSLG